MRDMKEGIKKVIDMLEEDEIRKGRCHLTDSQKELIEYGYIQCSLQIGYDVVSKGESFMAGLQEMALEIDKFEIAKNKIQTKINQLELATKTEFGEHAKMELEWVLSLLN
ncbi:hypothetical protein [Lacrimispora sp.]|uniref:hypothetical protein n=1 Tax=Lacrimispora sp. TaxID=2719234 RepID=UPI00289766A4|nr:hypothetical protein [Lacrimispora sp.]